MRKLCWAIAAILLVAALVYVRADEQQAQPHVVYSYEELKAALTQDNGIVEVCLGADIEMSGGLDIHPSKSAVVICGINPLEDDAPPHTLTEQSAVAQTSTMRLNAPEIKSVCLRDLVIVGKNYYGTVSVSELNGAADAVITYERVSYVGPQLVYNRRGTARFIDCDVEISAKNGGSPAQEVGEVKRVEFYGINRIVTSTSAYSVFWMPGGGSFVLADDASLLLESNSTSSLYGVLYCGGASNALELDVGSRAVLDVWLSDMLAPVGGSLFKNLTVREGGVFRLTSTATPTAAVLTVRGDFKVERGACFDFLGMASSSFVALRQETGDITVGENAIFHVAAASPYSALVNLVGRSFVSDNPASVLFKSGVRPIRADLAARLELSAQQVCYRATYTEEQDAPPDYRWTMEQGLLEIEATIAAGDAANLSSLSTNYVAGGQADAPPDVSNFSMKNARVLAWGRHEAAISAVKSGTSVVGGITSPDALVRVYLRDDSDQLILLGEEYADGYGIFEVETVAPLDGGTTVVVQTFWNYLSAETEAVVSVEGRLELFSPDTLDFTTTPITTGQVTIGRAERDFCLVVADTRGAGTKWRLFVGITGEFTPSDDRYPPLAGAAVFVGDTGEAVAIPKTEQMEIYSHTSTGEEELYTVSWAENRGPLLRLLPLGVCAGVAYTTSYVWTLIDGP